ncbi:MAG: DUF1934 domain-containing protein [Clostridia bacterium]|jgi:uncharacterized beta-barrel protein YwiB (DUF1934 family)|nr:DUF1934 domain-containing protein [Clostridia bacterium]
MKQSNEQLIEYPAAVHLTVNGQTNCVSGTLSRQGEATIVRFGEMQGFAPTKTQFTVWPDRVEMRKTGEFSTCISFTQGEKTAVELQTAMGAIPVTVFTTRLAVKTGQDLVFLRLSYTLSDGVENQIFSVTLRARMQAPSATELC